MSSNDIVREPAIEVAGLTKRFGDLAATSPQFFAAVGFIFDGDEQYPLCRTRLLTDQHQSRSCNSMIISEIIRIPTWHDTAGGEGFT